MIEIDKLLDFECEDVRIIGIWGIGGIGKTTIAEFIFHRYSSKFDSYCFLNDVKDKYREGGDTALQKEFLNQVLGGFDQNIFSRINGQNLIRKRLCHKKVLAVFDDVYSSRQLNALANSLEWFHLGSRIIVTTRDRHLLVAKKVVYIYEVQALNCEQSLQLFSRHAFNQNQPQEDFRELSNAFVIYAQGLPLALQVLGSFLCGLEMHEWQSELDKLNTFSNPDIYRVLKTSYDGLNDDFVKDLFLDIAFFFIGEDENKVGNILCRYGCTPASAFRILKDRALLTTKRNVLHMHDLIREMAHEIVREESKNPYKRSRLSNLEDVASMLTSGEGTSSIEGISLDLSKIKERYVEPNAFRKLCHLRILKFYKPRYIDERGAQCNRQRIQVSDNGFAYLPHELRYFQWDFFPAKYLVSTFCGQNLVELRLRESELECLWSGEIELGNLKLIDVSQSKHLKTFPDVSKATNIETVYLDGCESLVEFSSCLQHLRKVKDLSFRGCKKLGKLPVLPLNLSDLYLLETGITELSPEIKSLKNLQMLVMDDCKKLTTLPIEFGELTSLSELFIEKVPIKVLPEYSFSGLVSLEHLQLNKIALKKLPNSIGDLKSLKQLLLLKVPLTELPESIGNLNSLEGLELIEAALTALPDSIGNLKNLEHLQLKKVALTKLPNSIGDLKSLKRLRLRKVPLTELPESIGNLNSLERLKLIKVALTALPDSIGNLKSLDNLEVRDVALTKLPDSIGNLKNLKHLQLKEAALTKLPNSIGNLNSLEGLELIEVALTALPDSIGNLKNLELLQLKEVALTKLPNSIGDLKSLKPLLLIKVPLTELPESIGNLNSLERLELIEVALTALPDSIGNLKNLEHLQLKKVALTKLPDSIGDLKSLKQLQLMKVPLTELPESIGNLNSLECLKLIEVALTALPDSIGNLKSLDNLEVRDVALTKFPDSIGNLKSLKTLELNGLSITELPESIGHLDELLNLDLFECTSLAKLPSSIYKLSKLEMLDVNCCKSLCSLAMLPKSLSCLEAKSCDSFETLEGDSFCHLRNLVNVSFTGSNRLDGKACSEILEHMTQLHNFWFHCIVPGNEIPRWFDNRSDDAGIWVELPSPDRFQGFVLCVAYTIESPADRNELNWDFSSITVISPDFFRVSEFTRVNGQSEGVDHVLVWNERYEDPYAVARYLGLKSLFIFRANKLEVKVRKCGVRILFEENEVMGQSLALWERLQGH